jgi:gamma-glutamyltranspeptidase / glutathione hydrolase
MFCLFFDAKTRNVRSLNGSGRSNANLDLKELKKDLKIGEGKAGNIPTTSVHSITVPGAAAGWVDCVDRFGSGKVSLEQILAPAIKLAEEGFPVSELSSYFVRSFVPNQI